MKQNDYALPAAIFFSVLAWGIITYGGNTARSVALAALYAGAIGQFLVQSANPVIVGMGAAVTYFAMLLAGIGLYLAV